MDVNIVILNWNARTDTIACLHRLESWTRIERRIWVVDNGSEPDDSAAIASACPEAIVSRSDQNLGFSGGTNLGLRRALDESAAPVLLLNNDVRLDQDAVAILLETLQREPSCGIVGPVIYSAGDPARILSAGSRSPVLHRDHAVRRPPAGRRAYPVAFVSGAAALIRASVLQEVGLLDERYFFALELADLCRRARRRGFSCLIDTEARAEHDLARSSAHRETLYVYYVVRNRLLYARRCLRATWPALLAVWSLYGLQLALRLWFKQRRGTATAILLGVRDGLRGRFGNQNANVLRLCAAHSNEASKQT